MTLAARFCSPFGAATPFPARIPEGEFTLVVALPPAVPFTAWGCTPDAERMCRLPLSFLQRAAGTGTFVDFCARPAHGSMISSGLGEAGRESGPRRIVVAFGVVPSAEGGRFICLCVSRESCDGFFLETMEVPEGGDLRMDDMLGFFGILHFGLLATGGREEGDLRRAPISEERLAAFFAAA